MDTLVQQTLNNDFYINQNNDGFNLKHIFINNLISYFSGKGVSDGKSGRAGWDKNIIAWLARSSTHEAREIMRLSSPDYVLLDPPNTLIQKYLNDYFIFCENMLNDSYIKDKNHKDIWNHKGHLTMLRNKRFIDLDTEGLAINVFLGLRFLYDFTPGYLIKWIDLVVKHSRIRENFDAFKVTKCLKEFTSVVKKFRDSVFGEEWFYLADLDTCFGYNTQSKLSDVKEDIVSWAEYKDLKRDVSEEQYISGIKQELRKLFKEKRILNDIKLDDFLENSNYWVVSGSSNGVKTMVYDTISDELVRSKGVKAAIYINSVKKNILNQVKKKTKAEDFSPSVKIEIGFKNRLILACGNIEYIQMTYISHHLEKLLKGNPHSTLFNDNVWKVTNYVSNFNELWGTKNIFMPFDAAGFDKYVTLSEIMACFEVFEEQINKHFKHSIAKEDLSICISNLIESLKKGWNVKYENSSIKWEGGLPSGLRWTALLGTLINIARAKYIENKLMKELGVSAVLKKVVGQGDDDDFVFNSWFLGFKQFEYYKKLDIKAHYGKNFLDDRYTEYLKKVVDIKTKSVFSYPTRKITSLFFISPEKSKLPEESYDTINFGIYDIIRKRGYNIDSQYFENTNFIRLQYIPKTIGGFGSKLHNYGNKDHKVFRRVLTQRRYKVLKPDKGTLFRSFLNKVLSITADLNYSRDIFLERMFETFGARLAPKSNITNVKKELLRESNPLKLLSFSELLDLLFASRELNWKRPFLKKEYAFLPLKEIIATMNFNDLLIALRKYCDPVSLNSVEFVLNKYDLQVAKLKVSNILEPRYEYKTPYSMFYSDEFMSALFSETLNRMTLNTIIFSDNDLMSDDLSFRNHFIRFELSMFKIFNDEKQRLDKLLLQLFFGFEINKYN